MLNEYDERIEVMARHYIIAALWADSPEGTSPRATKKALEAARRDCAAFCQSAGSGFLDRAELDADDLGGELTAIAKTFGDANYEFYRGWLYLY